MIRSRTTAVAAALVCTALTLAAATPAEASRQPVKHRTFDLMAHRGGLGLRPESTLASFANGLEIGVSSLELDVQITKDGQAVVTHDRKVDGRKCLDTGPAFPATRSTPTSASQKRPQ
jgi:glycerophosphoryl diester phosphodiesterase